MKKNKKIKMKSKNKVKKGETKAGKKEISHQQTLIRDIVVSIAGQNALGIVDLLYGKKNVNEFLIAKKLNLTINQIRNILYKLVDEGLVSFVRKKDSKKGGWYTYYWTLDIGKSLSSLKDVLEKEIENLRSQVQSKKTKRFYYCPNCDVEYNEENALLHNFTCPECGEVLQLKDNLSIVSELEKNIERFEKSILEVKNELQDIMKKGEKAIERKLKAEQKHKEKERIAKKKQREREKKIEEKKKSRELANRKARLARRRKIKKRVKKNRI